jgi:hypothetical protein
LLHLYFLLLKNSEKNFCIKIEKIETEQKLEKRKPSNPPLCQWTVGTTLSQEKFQKSIFSIYFLGLVVATHRPTQADNTVTTGITVQMCTPVCTILEACDWLSCQWLHLVRISWNFFVGCQLDQGLFSPNIFPNQQNCQRLLHKIIEITNVFIFLCIISSKQLQSLNTWCLETCLEIP